MMIQTVTRFQDDADFVEAYDLKTDPYQLNNLAANLDDDENLSLREILSELRECRGWRQCGGGVGGGRNQMNSGSHRT